MRVGIVGSGGMGSTHAAGWAQTPAILAGVHSWAADSAAELAGRYGGRVYPDFESLLADVDVVDICTPTHLHHDMVLRAAAAGRHIVCEKPLARTLEQGREMIAACRAAGVTLLVAHVVRFFPEYALAKEQIAGGEIGRPAVIRLRRGSYQPHRPADNWFTDFEKSGGMMLDLMIHDFDYARWIGGEVKTVFARNIRVHRAEAPVDHGLAILTHRDGAISHIEGSWAYPQPLFRTRLEVAGDNGWLCFDSDETAPLKIFRHRQEGDAPDVPLPGSPLLESPYTVQIKAFYDHLNQGSPVRVTGADGLAALQIALAALESAATRQPVELSPLEEVPS